MMNAVSTFIGAFLQKNFDVTVPKESSLPLLLALSALLLFFSVPSLVWSLLCGRRNSKSSNASGPSYEAFKSGVTLFHVDSFATRPFAGNPAAVCVLDREPDKFQDEQWLLNVAKETAQPMTAFLLRKDSTTYDIRWFQPESEHRLCGHATLAAAHVLFSTGVVPQTSVLTLHSHLAGVLKASCVVQFGNSTLRGRVQLDFPALSVTQKISVSEAQKEGLDIESALNLENEDISFIGSNGSLLLIEVKEPRLLQVLSPNGKILSEWATRGVVVTAPVPKDQTIDSVFGNGIRSPVDFVSRVFFASKQGVAEDPVTGSAHCLLACHYADRLKKFSFTAYQASERGGLLELHLVEGKSRVKIAGDAVTLVQGRLIV